LSAAISHDLFRGVADQKPLADLTPLALIAIDAIETKIIPYQTALHGAFALWITQ
jgi:hypothetical protein